MQHQHFPRGWGPQPGTPPQAGYPHPGYAGPSPGWQPPRRKKGKGGLITTIVLVSLVVLGCLGTLGYFVKEYYEPVGQASNGGQVPQRCRLSEGLLRQLHTTNPNPRGSDGGASGTSLDITMCDWNQTRGVDGRDTRDLSFTITTHNRTELSTKPLADAEEDFRNERDFVERDRREQHRITDVQGLGDEAFLNVMPDGSYVQVNLVLREDNQVVNISYAGSNKTFFGSEPMPVSEGTKAVKAVAAEILRKP